MRTCMSEGCDKPVEFSLWIGWPKRRRYSCAACAFEADKRAGLVEKATRVAMPGMVVA